MSEESAAKKINEVDGKLATTIALITLVGVFVLTYAMV